MALDLNRYFDERFLDFRILGVARSYLLRQGWFHSLSGESRDADGPVPWVTYPAASMLKRIISPSSKVFEYGCGYSTMWWRKMVASVVSVEHDLNWILRIRPELPEGAVVVHRAMHCPVEPSHAPVLDEFFANNYDLPASGNPAHDAENGLLCREFSGYAAEILDYPAGHFDVVVVDGMARVLTAWLAARQLGENGIILFDNTDRWQYNAAYQLLQEAGFAKIDFWGIGPVLDAAWCTSLFVRGIEALKRNSVVGRHQPSDLGW